jgi:hypothetical protein
VTVSVAPPVPPIVGPPVEEPFTALGRAVAAGCPAEFVDAADLLLGGVARLRDAAGVVLACSRDQVDEAELRVLALHRDGTVLGRLDLARGTTGHPAHDGVLRGLAGALLEHRRQADEVRELRHRVALLSWTSAHPEIAGEVASGGPHGSSCCRPVVVGAAAARLPALRTAVAGDPLLAGASLVPADGMLLGVYPDGGRAGPQAHAAAWSRAVAALPGPPPPVAVGRPAGAGEPLRASYLQARHVATLQGDHTGILDLPAVAVIDELGPMADVLSTVSSGQLVPFVQRVLGGLLADTRFGGQLAETLYAYLTTGGSPQEAGRLLHLHASSVKYRMRAIRELLGPRLDDPAQRFDIELAVRLYLAGQQLATHG